MNYLAFSLLAILAIGVFSTEIETKTKIGGGGDGVESNSQVSADGGQKLETRSEIHSRLLRGAGMESHAKVGGAGQGAETKTEMNSGAGHQMEANTDIHSRFLRGAEMESNAKVGGAGQVESKSQMDSGAGQMEANTDIHQRMLRDAEERTEGEAMEQEHPRFRRWGYYGGMGGYGMGYGGMGYGMGYGMRRFGYGYPMWG